MIAAFLSLLSSPGACNTDMNTLRTSVKDCCSSTSAMSTISDTMLNCQKCVLFGSFIRQIVEDVLARIGHPRSLQNLCTPWLALISIGVDRKMLPAMPGTGWSRNLLNEWPPHSPVRPKNRTVCQESGCMCLENPVNRFQTPLSIEFLSRFYFNFNTR